MAIPVFPGEVPGSGVIYKRGKIQGPPIRDNLAAWFRYGRGITSSGGTVSQWDDASGNGRHLKQGTATNQPALKEDMSILFDGADNFMKCDAFTFSRPYSVYLLGKQVTWTSGDTSFDGNTANRFALQQNSSSPRVRLADSGLATAVNAEWTLNVDAVVFASQSGTTGTLQINGGTAVVGTISGFDMAGFTLGANGTPGNYANIQVKEVLLYTAAHDLADRLAVIKYLARVGRIAL